MAANTYVQMPYVHHVVSPPPTKQLIKKQTKFYASFDYDKYLALFSMENSTKGRHNRINDAMFILWIWIYNVGKENDILRNVANF